MFGVVNVIVFYSVIYLVLHVDEDETVWQILPEFLLMLQLSHLLGTLNLIQEGLINVCSFIYMYLISCSKEQIQPYLEIFPTNVKSPRKLQWHFETSHVDLKKSYCNYSFSPFLLSSLLFTHLKYNVILTPEILIEFHRISSCACLLFWWDYFKKKKSYSVLQKNTHTHQERKKKKLLCLCCRKYNYFSQ